MERIGQITGADRAAARAAKQRWDGIAKPIGSFGLLEDLIVKIAAVQGIQDVDLSRRTAVVMCADHGVVAEGVSQSGQEVTALSTAAIACGSSNINALADAYGTDVIAVDIGVSKPFAEGTLVTADAGRALRRPGAPKGTGAVLDRKLSRGTGDILKEPAMTPEMARRAIVVGMDLVRDLKATGTRIVVTGEMGIGNTTIASALAAVYLGLPPQEVTGRGAGLPDASLARKKEVVAQAVSLHRPDRTDPIDVLSKLGGLEVAGMAGLFLGGAAYGIPVVIDGVISAAAAYTAYLLNPLAAEYMLAGHVSAEPAGGRYLEALGLQAPIDAHLRLGEGTGGILLLPLLDGALALYRDAHTFGNLGLEAYVDYGREN